MEARGAYGSAGQRTEQIDVCAARDVHAETNTSFTGEHAQHGARCDAGDIEQRARHTRARPAAALCTHLHAHTREHIHVYVFIYMIEEWRKEGPS